MIFAVILAILDAQMAGLLTRYFTDFVWIAFIGTIITAFAYYEMLRDNEHSRRKFAGIILTFFSNHFSTLLFVHLCAYRGFNNESESNIILYSSAFNSFLDVGSCIRFE